MRTCQIRTNKQTKNKALYQGALVFAIGEMGTVSRPSQYQGTGQQGRVVDMAINPHPDPIQTSEFPLVQSDFRKKKKMKKEPHLETPNFLTFFPPSKE